jgi:hypothetical protein
MRLRQIIVLRRGRVGRLPSSNDASRSVHDPNRVEALLGDAKRN